MRINQEIQKGAEIEDKGFDARLRALDLACRQSEISNSLFQIL